MKSAVNLPRVVKIGLFAATALALSATSVGAYDHSGDGYYDYDGGIDTEGPNGPAGPGGGFGPAIGLGFNGITQLDVRALHSNLSSIPPDTNGAVGANQFFETTNGAYAVYDKATGTQTKLWADGNFWQAAGQPLMNGPNNFSNGDSRVLYDAQSQKFAIISFGATLGQIAIAVSDTSDALGGWKSAVFTGYDDHVGTGIADYPTLAIDSKAVYIGTNNFTQTAGACGTPFSLCSTTLNVLSRNDIFGAGGPGVGSLKQFTTPFTNVPGSEDRGFAIQGVNQVGGNDAGKIVAISALDFGPVAYSVLHPGTAGATQTGVVQVDTSPYQGNSLAAQPNGKRYIDPLDDRISSEAWEYKGNIYTIHTITLVGQTHTSLEFYVLDAATGAVIQKGIIGDGVHDYFQGSIAINNSGQLLFSYNRSGFGADGKVSILAQQFNPTGGGLIGKVGSEILLYVSPIDNYHNGSPQFSPPSGRQRWGDYSQVTVDPNNPQSFWVVGEYALGYLPNRTASNSRWGTWISNVNIGGVPEPSTWGLMIVGFGFAGVALRRRRATA